MVEGAVNSLFVVRVVVDVDLLVEEVEVEIEEYLEEDVDDAPGIVIER